MKVCLNIAIPSLLGESIKGAEKGVIFIECSSAGSRIIIKYLSFFYEQTCTEQVIHSRCSNLCSKSLQGLSFSLV